MLTFFILEKKFPKLSWSHLQSLLQCYRRPRGPAIGDGSLVSLTLTSGSTFPVCGHFSQTVRQRLLEQTKPPFKGIKDVDILDWDC